MAGPWTRLGTRIAGNTAGKVLSSGFGVVKGLAGSVASAARGLSSLESQPSQEIQKVKSSSGNVIYVDFGMASSAGKQRVSSGSTLPAPKAIRSSGMNENMPTDRLLNIAIKQLSSINSTLRKQLEFDKRVYDQAIAAEREATIERQSPFSGMKERLSGLVDREGIGDRAKGLFNKKTLLTALGLAGAGALVAGSLDESQFDQLNKNIEQFKQDYKWLFDLAASIGTGVGVGGLTGYLLGGMKGAIAGIAIGAVTDYFGFKNTASIVGGAYAAYRVGKTGLDIFRRSQAVGKIRSTTSARAISTMRTAGGRTLAQGAARGWLSGPIGKRFLAYLVRKRGAVFVKAIIKLLAKVTAGLAVTATGVGAIPGLLWTLVSIGMAIWDVYDLIGLWNDFQDEEQLKKDAEALKAQPQKQDAQKMISGGAGAPSTGIVSKSETGRPEEAQSFFESRGWTKEQAAGIVGNLVVESGLRTDAVGDGGKAYGIAQWHPDRQATFKNVFNKDIRESSFQEQLAYVDWELRNSEARAGQLLRNAKSAQEAAAIVDRSYERSSGAMIAERQANAAAIAAGDYSKVSTAGARDYLGAGGAAGAMMTDTLEQTARLIGSVGSKLVGPGTLRNINTPLPSTTDKSKSVNDMSVEVGNLMKFGKLEASKQNIINQSTPAKALTIASPSGTISVVNPNWEGLGDSKNPLNKYLANFKLVA